MMSSSFRTIKKIPQTCSVKKPPHQLLVSQMQIHNNYCSAIAKRWSVISPSYHTQSPQTTRAKLTRNNPIFSQINRRDTLTIKPTYTQSFLCDNGFQLKNSTQVKGDVVDISLDTEEQVTVIENDCENDYSLLIRSLNIQNNQ